MNRQLKYSLTGITALLLTSTILASCTSTSEVSSAQAANDWKPVFTQDDQLVLPEGYREWVFLGSPITPNGMNGGEAGFPEYHNVYIHPEAYRIYKETGEFAEGTILLKELQLSIEGTEEDGSRFEVSGRGYFPGAYNGIDIAVKDSTRYAESQNWGYFNFGHHAPPYAETAAAAPVDSCAFCHIENADRDMVFTRFYRLLDQ